MFLNTIPSSALPSQHKVVNLYSDNSLDEITFKLSNQSKNDIQISRVEVSCGCFDYKLENKSIESGKTVNFSFVVNTDDAEEYSPNLSAILYHGNTSTRLSADILWTHPFPPLIDWGIPKVNEGNYFLLRSNPEYFTRFNLKSYYWQSLGDSKKISIDNPAESVSISLPEEVILKVGSSTYHDNICIEYEEENSKKIQQKCIPVIIRPNKQFFLKLSEVESYFSNNSESLNGTISIVYGVLDPNNIEQISVENVECFTVENINNVTINWKKQDETLTVFRVKIKDTLGNIYEEKVAFSN